MTFLRKWRVRTLRWKQNWIPRQKKFQSFFEPFRARLFLKFAKCVNITSKCYWFLDTYLLAFCCNFYVRKKHPTQRFLYISIIHLECLWIIYFIYCHISTFWKNCEAKRPLKQLNKTKNLLCKRKWELFYFSVSGSGLSSWFKALQPIVQYFVTKTYLHFLPCYLYILVSEEYQKD